MRRWGLAGLLATLLVSVAGVVSAADETITVTSLQEVRAKLLGAEGGARGLVPTGVAFSTEFQGVALTAADVPAVLRLILDTLALPPRSSVVVAGTLDNQPFSARWARGRTGQLDTFVRGLKVDAHAPVFEFLGALAQQRLDTVRVRYTLGARLFQAKLEENP